VLSVCVVKDKSCLVAYSEGDAGQMRTGQGVTVMMIMMMRVMIVVISVNTKSGKDELSHSTFCALAHYRI
jgi:hypothetical protein